MYIEKFYTCKYDRPFKEIFLKEKNKDMLKELLELILKEKIERIELGPNERNTGNIYVRRKTYDALVYTNKSKIEIEVNSGVEKYLYPRNASYIFDLYSHHTLVGEEYNEDTMIIQINFTYGLGKKHNIINEYYVMNEEKERFIKNLKIIELNMDYYLDLWYDKNREKNMKLIEKNKMLIMLGLEKEELKNLSEEYKEVKRYMEDLNYINHSPEFREYMTEEEDKRKIFNTKMREAIEEGLKKGMEEGLKKGLEQGLEQGIEQGIEHGSRIKELEIVKNMKKNKMKIEDISKITGLSLEDIEKI